MHKYLDAWILIGGTELHVAAKTFDGHCNGHAKRITRLFRIAVGVLPPSSSLLGSQRGICSKGMPWLGPYSDPNVGQEKKALGYGVQAQF